MPRLAISRGEFDLDLGAEGAGDLFERQQRHPVVISSLQARDIGLLHADLPRELGLRQAFLQPSSDQTLRRVFHIPFVHSGSLAAFLCAAGIS